MKKNPGCYVDGARGIYVVDRVMQIAQSNGFKAEPSDSCDCYDPTSIPLWHDCQFASEHEDEATAFMEGTYPVEGYYWGRNDNGDWGLWEIEGD